MKLFKLTTTIFCAALMGAAAAPTAHADEWNKKTVVTFSGPVEIPGVHLAGWKILPAGTYVFKLMDSQSDRHIVQIFSKDESTIYATILAVPNERLTPTDKTVITFSERPADQPEAIRAWFYPGSTVGEEFVYPKAKAMELAKASNVPVFYTSNESAETTEPIAPFTAPADASTKSEPIMVAKPNSDEPLATPVATPAALPASLPATAGYTPLIGLLGLILLGGSLIIGASAKRTA